MHACGQSAWTLTTAHCTPLPHAPEQGRAFFDSADYAMRRAPAAAGSDTQAQRPDQQAALPPPAVTLLSNIDTSPPSTGDCGGGMHARGTLPLVTGARRTSRFHP